MAKPCAKARHDERSASSLGVDHASRLDSHGFPAVLQRRAAATAAFRFDFRGSWPAERRPILAKSGEMSFQLLRQIGLFPGKTALGVGRTAEMAVGGSPRVNWPVKLQMFPDAARGKAHDLEEGCLELFFRDVAGAVGIDIDRQRFR